MGHPDTGCPDGYLPSCLSCPLERCRYEEGESLRRMLNVDRNDLVMGMLSNGVPVPEIAAQAGISERTIWRAHKEMV